MNGSVRLRKEPLMERLVQQNQRRRRAMWRLRSLLVVWLEQRLLFMER